MYYVTHRKTIKSKCDRMFITHVKIILLDGMSRELNQCDVKSTYLITGIKKQKLVSQLKINHS
jgi:hypothetical protein